MKINEIIETRIDEIDRRGFLRGLGAAGAAAAVPGLAKAQSQTLSPEYENVMKDIKYYLRPKFDKLPNPMIQYQKGKIKVTMNGTKIIRVEMKESTGLIALDNLIIRVINAESTLPQVQTLVRTGAHEIEFSTKNLLPAPGETHTQTSQPQQSQPQQSQPQQSQPQQSQQDILYGNIKIGMSIEEIIKNNPSIKADDQWSSAGIAGPMGDYFGVDSPRSRIKAAGPIKGPYGKDAKIFILTNKNLQCNGVVIYNVTQSLPESWLEDHGTLFGFNKGEFLTFLKKVVSNIPQSMGTRSGKLKTREDGGLGLSGGFGAAVPVGKNGAFGIGVGMAKTGFVAITQKLENRNIDSNMIVFAETISHQLSGMNVVRPNIIFTLQDKSAVVPDLDIE